MLTVRSTRDLGADIAAALATLSDYLPQTKGATEPTYVAPFFKLVEASLVLMTCRERALHAPADLDARTHALPRG